MRSKRSKFYYCHACPAAIQVIGPEKDDYKALTRVDWKVRTTEGKGLVACRKHELP